MLPNSDPQFLPISHPAGVPAHGHMAVVQTAVEGEVARAQPLELESSDRQGSGGSLGAMFIEDWPQDFSEPLYGEEIHVQVRQSISIQTVLHTEGLTKGLQKKSVLPQCNATSESNLYKIVINPTNNFTSRYCWVLQSAGTGK